MIDDLSVTADNFADGNIFVCFRKTIQKLIASLQYECETAFNWSSENMIISNPGKFQIIPSNKIKTDHTNGTSKINFKENKVACSIKLFEIEIDNKLNSKPRKNRVSKRLQINAL